jgi:hypothetical protein
MAILARCLTMSVAYQISSLVNLFLQWSLGLMVKGSLGHCIKQLDLMEEKLGIYALPCTLAANPIRWSFIPGINGFRGFGAAMTKHPAAPG